MSQMAKREIQSRYKGSILSWGWSLVTPLLMLSVYTFVFSQVFQARWGESDNTSPLGFSINLFAGLIVFNIFSETINQAPTCILSNANLVTKVVFPVQILPVVALSSALFNALASLSILLTFQVANGAVAGIGYGVQATIFYLPLVILPFLTGCLALSWALAGLGVYLRDLSQTTSVITSLLIFLSAVFYPLAALPAKWQPYLQLNPLVRVIEECRRVVVQGESPSPDYVIVGTLLGLASCEVAYRFFRKAQRGFADVL